MSICDLYHNLQQLTFASGYERDRNSVTVSNTVNECVKLASIRPLPSANSSDKKKQTRDHY